MFTTPSLIGSHRILQFIAKDVACKTNGSDGIIKIHHVLKSVSLNLNWNNIALLHCRRKWTTDVALEMARGMQNKEIIFVDWKRRRNFYTHVCVSIMKLTDTFYVCIPKVVITESRPMASNVVPNEVSNYFSVPQCSEKKLSFSSYRSSSLSMFSLHRAGCRHYKARDK